LREELHRINISESMLEKSAFSSRLLLDENGDAYEPTEISGMDSKTYAN